VCPEPEKALNGLNNAAQGSEGDCAEPNRARYDVKLAEEADLVVSGLAVSMGPGTPVCAGSSTSGSDLLVQDGEQEDGSQVLLFWVQCVHKGALVCRRNEADNTAKPPRCMIAVKVPAQAAAPGQLPPCTVTRGFRWVVDSRQLATFGMLAQRCGTMTLFNSALQSCEAGLHGSNSSLEHAGYFLIIIGPL